MGKIAMERRRYLVSFSALLISLCQLTCARADKEEDWSKTAGSALTQLTPWNFDELVGGEKHVLAMFYAPWCGGCKKFMPKYVDTVRMLEGNNIVLAKADATE